MNLRPELTESEAVAIAEKIRDEMINGGRTKDICANYGWSEGDLHRLRRKYASVHAIILEGIQIRNDIAMFNVADVADDLIFHIEESSFKNRLDALKFATAERKSFSSKFDTDWQDKTVIDVNATVKRDMTELTDEQLAAIATGRTGTASET
jgi:hypothetical protein